MARQNKRDPLERAVREILFNEWDPIGVKDEASCEDEYDSYVAGLCRLLERGADVVKIAAHLRRLQVNSMGLSWIDDDHNRHVADRLVSFRKGFPKRYASS